MSEIKKRTTEAESNYQDLELMNTSELLFGINKEDKTVAFAVENAIPQITILTNKVIEKLKEGGRLFYLGAGTSGRLGIVDASEIPPTYGIEHGIVVGLIAGGDSAIRKAVEFAEDDWEAGWNDLMKHHICNKDFVIGIAASGTTPYVIGAVKKCNESGIETGCIVCNEGSPLAKEAKFPIEVICGPEFVTGSTRMKAGTAQKLVLNMISTSAMISLGRVKGNRMVDMQLSNNKLLDRGTLMIVEKSGISYEQANVLLKEHGSVRNVLNFLGK